ncbi:hypothetical protein RCL1_001889 [Eukaryota sp. TZLM3-RCL]
MVSPSIVPISVNYHFTRKCNFQCKYCFHTSKTSHVECLENAKIALRKLKAEGMKKLNLVGGEPFLYPEFLGELIVFCKEELQLESLSIVSNGSLVTRDFFESFGRYVDIFAVSIDSDVNDVNAALGRSRHAVQRVRNIKRWCDEFKILFKVNSVICSLNWNLDLNDFIQELNPYRWKVFQVLVLEGENSGDYSQRDAQKLLITAEQFKHFCEVHGNQPSLVVEKSSDMQNSYLILDEYLRFLNCQSDSKVPTESILNVSVQEALAQSGFDQEAFLRRGGVFKWSKDVLNDW